LGYDVWLGNQRGNKYSHTHKNPNITREKFFSYTFDDMARYDIPSVIDYVYKNTNKKIIYLGHSLGTTQMFASLSDKKTTKFVHDRLELFIALAPVVYMKNIEVESLEILSQLFSAIEYFSKLLNFYEVLPGICAKKTDFMIEIMEFVCQNFGSDCMKLMPAMMMSNKDYLPDMKKLFNHYPSGTSIKLFYQMAQIVNAKDYRFQKFDYQKKQNMRVYGKPKPPKYNLKNVKAKLKIIHFEKDKLSTSIDTDEI